MALFLQALFQRLGSFKVAFRILIRKKYYTLNGDFAFTLLNKAIFTSHLKAFASVSQYYTV